MVKKIVKCNDGYWECEITINESGLEHCVKLKKINPADTDDNQNLENEHILLLEKEIELLKEEIKLLKK